MNLDAQTLARCTAARLDRAQRFFYPLNAAMVEFGIDTPQRQAMFLANVGHESGGLHWTSELWGPTPQQLGYEGRHDLGNTQPGDGFKYRGRGLIQITGRNNYTSLTDALGVDYIIDADQLAEPVDASRSAGWFWNAHNLNQYADGGDFLTCVKKINGGYTGLSERQILWAAAKAALHLA